MTRRAFYNRGYRMFKIWDMGSTVTVAGTKYRVENNGWKKVVEE